MSAISASRRGAARKAKAPKPARGKPARLEARPTAAKAPPPPAALIASTPSAEPDVHCSHDAMAPLANLKPNPRNPNKHPEAQIRLLAKVIARAGWRSPIVVSNRSGLITKGHGRFEAAKLAGMTVAPIDFQDYASEADELADMIADNRLAELAEIELPEMKELLESLGAGFDFDLTGYDSEALADLLAKYDVESIGVPVLKDGEKTPFSQMTFTVHNDQFIEIEAAIKSAKKAGGGESAVNENSNGNALAFICQAFNREARNG